MLSNDDAPAPLQRLGKWIDAAREAGLPHPASVAFITADDAGRPTARTVTLKRIAAGRLVFTSALWTRKAREIAQNPAVALLFHWPSLGRQVHVTGVAHMHTGPQADALFAERDRRHQLQTAVSRQGEVIDDLAPLRARLAKLRASGKPVERPDEWGVIEVVPGAVEFWDESPDRLHVREVYVHDRGTWSSQLLAP